MRRLLWLLPWMVAAGCASCGDDATTDGPPPGSGLVELGTGATAWEPLAAEQDVPLYTGTQGGHHFIVHARIRGLLPGDPAIPGQLANPITRFAVLLPDGAGGETQIDMMFPPYRLGYEREGDGWYAMSSGRILQLQEQYAEAAVGARVHFTVMVTDASGQTVTDERWVNAYAGPVVGFGDAGPVDGVGDGGAVDGPPPLGAPDAGP